MIYKYDRLNNFYSVLSVFLFFSYFYLSSFKMSTIEIIGTRKKLWCINRNDKCIFKVTVGVENDIYDLKEIIAEKEKISNIKATRLVLWRTNLENNRSISLDESLDDELKNETEKVGNVFS